MDFSGASQSSGDNDQSTLGEGAESMGRAQRDRWIREFMEGPELDLRELDEFEPQPQVLRDVKNETLDPEFIEKRLVELSSQLPEVDRFCQDCWYNFENWPEAVGPDHPRFLRFVDTIKLEAVARKGCRFCSFLLRNLVTYNLLDVIRSIEARLQEGFEIAGEYSRPMYASLWVVQHHHSSSNDRLRFLAPGQAWDTDTPCCSCEWNYAETNGQSREHPFTMHR
jgi:hypothetical protein